MHISFEFLAGREKNANIMVSGQSNTKSQRFFSVSCSKNRILLSSLNLFVVYIGFSVWCKDSFLDFVYNVENVIKMLLQFILVLSYRM